ncbi:hypothetical protein SAMN04488122_0651 [Chitinophaga arvensicola]|uniref:Uncharacterized protein n=1 Tax=Chitinophaga arvensicola TaxID=29529 RepID=A0A1I0P9J4_9BACT|nr:hypothetical protein SAMN04488122_0651 [Chitinophaga arvensicola]
MAAFSTFDGKFIFKNLAKRKFLIAIADPRLFSPIRFQKMLPGLKKIHPPAISPSSKKISQPQLIPNHVRIPSTDIPIYL